MDTHNIAGEAISNAAAVGSKGVTAGVGMAISGGVGSVLGLGINEWMSIVGGACALLGVFIAWLNYRGNERLRSAQIAEIGRGRG